MVIYNFSHPLNAEVIKKVIGDNDVEVIDIPCQIDMDGNIISQISEMIDKAFVESGGEKPDIVNPPALACAAWICSVKFHYAKILAWKRNDFGGFEPILLNPAEIL